MLCSVCMAGINWQKFRLWVWNNEPTWAEIQEFAPQQIATYLETDPNTIQRSVWQLKIVGKAVLVEKAKTVKFNQVKNFILNQDPTAVVERDGDDIVIRGYLAQ